MPGSPNGIGGLWHPRFQTSSGLRAGFLQAFVSINFFHLLVLPALPFS